MDYSFIIPVYNCKTYLENCVDSIRQVKVERREIILVDDGSSDGSGELCDTLAARYPEIRVIHQPNGGVSAARNRGIQEALGDKLLFVDADDTLDHHQLGQILRDPRCNEVDLVIFGIRFDYYARGRCYRRDAVYYDHDGTLSRERWSGEFEELFLHNSLSPVWNKVFKKEILTKYRLLLDRNLFLYEDLEFVLRYLQHCDSIWNIPQAVYYYRQTEDEGNAKRRLERIDSLPLLLRPIEDGMDKLASVPLKVRKEVLLQLYLVLAREKISVSNLAGTRRICREFKSWEQQREIPLRGTKFEQQLLDGKAVALLLEDKKTMLRHKAAVWVKSHFKINKG